MALPNRICALLLLFIVFSNIQVSSSTSSFSTALETLQKQLGYEFQSIDLLRRAMTHPSFSGENFRTLSILGLGVVQSSISLKLLQKNLEVSTKEMDGRMKAVSDVAACAAAGSRMGLEKVVRVSAKTNASAPAVVCGAFRAAFGGVALDSGKLDVAGEVFWRVNGGGFVAVM